MPNIPLLEVKKQQFDKMNEKVPSDDINRSFYLFNGDQLDISEQLIFRDYIKEKVVINLDMKVGA